MGKPVKRVQEHKHLGLTLTQNLSWDSHIKSVCNKAAARIGRLRKCMYTLPLSALESIYITGIRPILEYAAPVIDNCTQRCSDMLESVQYRAALAVSGAMNTSSRIKVLKCLAWPSLGERRKYFKLVLYFKLVNDLCPPHLRELLPEQNNDRHNYMLRNVSERRLPHARINAFAGSFIPSASRLWNSLPENVRAARSIQCFKLYIKQLLFPPRLDHLRHGPRKLNMLLNRLRVDFSALNAHLFTRRLKETQICHCGYHTETTYHFLLQCPSFTVPRQIFLARISEIIQTSHSNIVFDNLPNFEKVSVCLFGHTEFAFATNCKILEATMKYIQRSKRFSKYLSDIPEDVE